MQSLEIDLLFDDGGSSSSMIQHSLAAHIDVLSSESEFNCLPVNIKKGYIL